METVSDIKVVRQSVDDRLKIIVEDANKLNFAYSFRPIYYFSRTVGLMPFSIAYDSNGNAQEPRVKRLDALWFVVSISCYIFVAWSTYRIYYLAILQSPYTILVLNMCDYLLLIGELIFAVVMIAMDMWNRFNLVDILKKIQYFDKKASNSIAIWARHFH